MDLVGPEGFKFVNVCKFYDTFEHMHLHTYV